MNFYQTRLFYKFQTLAAAVFLFLLSVSANAAIWYVDNTASGANNGTSWANAWTSLSSASGSSVAAGDTVYISGGPTGATQTYSISSGWAPKGGASGNRITYQIGQDSQHNGTAVFSGSGSFITAPSNANILGDAGDGKQHFATSGCTGITGGSFSNLRIGYINFGTMLGNINGACLYAGSVNGFEFDHNYVYQSNNAADAIIHVDGYGGNNYDQNLIHDNVLYTPGKGGGFGADGLVMSGVGYSIYNNTLINYRSSTYSAAQHSDGWQTSGGSYVKIYNNLIHGFSDIGLYGGCWGNAVAGGQHTFSHVRIYNNVIDGGVGQQAVGCIEVEADDQTGSTFSDIGIYNNLCRVPTSTQGWGLFIGSSSTTGGTWNNVWATNNFIIAPTSAQRTYVINCTFSESNNPWFTDAQAASMMANFVAGSATSDYHLSAAATALIGKGVNLSSWVTTDKDGKARPAAGAWDIGPYQYGSISTNPTISVSLPTLNFGLVPTATSVTNSITVQNVAGGTLAGTASVPVPFKIVSGGTYSLGANQSQVVMVSFNPQTASSVTNTVTFSGGGGTVVNVNGTGVIPPPIVSAISQSGSDIDPITPGLQVYAGSVLQYSGAASDPSGLPLNWQWIYTVNGGSEVVAQSGAGAVTSLSYNYTASLAGNTYVWKLRVSNGNTTAESSLTVGVVAPPPPPGALTFQATSGSITAPFVVTSGYVSQSTLTSVTNGGRAVYSFTITNAGSYVVQVLLSAPNDAANSLFLNIDGLPQDPSMIWDIPMTTGFEQRILSWRGNGTFDNAQFVPKVFDLSVGTHQITVVGREANVQLQSLSILQLPQPPTGLHIL